MDTTYSITILPERKRGEHLDAESRGVISHMKKLGYSNRAIARELDCSPSTVGYELRRGTPVYTGLGRKPIYSAKRGAAVYKANRSRCRRPKSIPRDSDFLRWMVKQIREHKWSFDSCVGYARVHKLFPAETIPCTKTLYQLLWKGELPLTLFELPEILQRRRHAKPRISKRLNGRSIEQREAEVAQRDTFGHWESDTVLGQKRKNEPAVFTMVERLTGCYLTIRTNEKTSDGIAAAMEQLHAQFGERFEQIFRTITTDNGSEFAAFSSFESWGTKVYFAHAYSAWERPVNERSNRLLRRFVPKGVSLKCFSDEDILIFSDELNALPRKRLDYRTPEELFDEYLDKIYALR